MREGGRLLSASTVSTGTPSGPHCAGPVPAAVVSVSSSVCVLALLHLAGLVYAVISIPSGSYTILASSSSAGLPETLLNDKRTVGGIAYFKLYYRATVIKQHGTSIKTDPFHIPASSSCDSEEMVDTSQE